MQAVTVVHESILYAALKENVDDEQQRDAEEFLNKCAVLNYEGKNAAYLPGDVFDRISKLTNVPGWEKLIAFFEMLIIKYSDKKSSINYHFYVYLASELSLKNRVCIASTNDKFNKWVHSAGFIFPTFPPKLALKFISEE